MRKVPWGSPAEFIQVFDLLFSSSPDSANNQSIALNHLYAWAIRSPATLPPAIEATHALLALLLPPTPSQQQQRLGLAMGIARLVNSLVDPEQKGLYARSISQIASQLGLPLSLVQLRHRATHEHLPSLTILLESANLALDWLYAHYWLPRLNDIEGTSQLKSETMGALEGILLSYKRARKRAMLDVTQAEYLQLIPQFDNWINTASRELRGDGGHSRLPEDDGDPDHRPLAALCSIMVHRHVLIPQSLKKRCQSLKDPLPEPLQNLYEPLIDHLAQSHPQLFIRSLVFTLLDILATAPEDPDTKSSPADSSHHHTCAGWLVYLLLRAEGELVVEEALRSLLMKPNNPYTLSIVERIKHAKRADWSFDQAVSPLIAVLRHQAHACSTMMAHHPHKPLPADHLVDARLKQMKQRWDSLAERDDQTPPDDTPAAWSLAPLPEWAPCPIGCLPDRSVPLLYQSLRL
ncbi:hypothetical protein PCANC_27332 [Puccinia coronata f. sp. avenae]|uniref:Las1-domain-containing protein n=1 Tax=Puccinia coronata f. sp. avenae TaxID=200324 RepID=A0A2N5S806_9BASI|nr:hypothetical protein PCANC_27332 [Puccinia coronata f. sp. avenae]